MTHADHAPRATSGAEETSRAARPGVTDFVELARPKVNLTLEIRGRRGDGYHELASLVAFAAHPADRIVFTPADLPPAMPRGLTVTGRMAAAIEGPNLLERALALVAAQAPAIMQGRTLLEKVLPVAAGIGGGSADAAALLRALRRALPAALAARIDWPAIALDLGADVPVCLDGRTSWMTGIGDVLAPVAGLPRLPAVLVNPLGAVPPDKTARVFRALAARPLDPDAPPPRQPRIWPDVGAQIGELAAFRNDLTAPATAVLEVIAVVLAALDACDGCRLARLSGAGPTAFGLFETTDDAAGAARRIGELFPSWWVVATNLGD